MRNLIFAVVLLSGTFAVSAQNQNNLAGHVPAVARRLAPKGQLTATNELSLAIEVPMRDRAGLENFVKEVSDHNSPNFRHYLTHDEITARFGPTEEDYEAVKNFARTNGFVIRDTYPNRLVLNVSSPAATVERAFTSNCKPTSIPRKPVISLPRTRNRRWMRDCLWLTWRV